VEGIAACLPVHLEVDGEPVQMDAEVEQGNCREGEHGEAQRKVKGSGPGTGGGRALVGLDHGCAPDST
jgi:hypothetical protein